MSIGPDTKSLLPVHHRTSVTSCLTSLFEFPKLGAQTDFRDASLEDDPANARLEPGQHVGFGTA